MKPVKTKVKPEKVKTEKVKPKKVKQVVPGIEENNGPDNPAPRTEPETTPDPDQKIIVSDDPFEFFD